MALPNKYRFKKVELGMIVISKYDIISFPITESDDAGCKNIYRGQLGYIAGYTNDGKHIVVFKDIDDEFDDFNDGYINDLEMDFDQFIPVILPYSLPQPEKEESQFFWECYDDLIYSKGNILLDRYKVELEQDQNQDFEAVSCPETELCIQHNKTFAQFEPHSLVTFQDVLKGANNGELYIFPGQVGIIIKKLNTPTYDPPEYVEVLLLPLSLLEWDRNKDMTYSQWEIFSNDGRNGLCIVTHKFNLVPIFQTRLKANDKGKTQITSISGFYDWIGSLNKDQYLEHLNTLNVSSAEKTKKLELFHFFKKRSSTK